MNFKCFKCNTLSIEVTPQVIFKTMLVEYLYK